MKVAPHKVYTLRISQEVVNRIEPVIEKSGVSITQFFEQALRYLADIADGKDGELPPAVELARIKRTKKGKSNKRS